MPRASLPPRTSGVPALVGRAVRAARSLLVALVWAALLPLSGCTAPYFADAARDFGTAITSPAADMGPYLRGIPNLCRRHADLAYLRSRLEDPQDQRLIPWAERRTARYRDRKNGIEDRCKELDSEVALYAEMYTALRAYGLALRALGDTEGVDFRESFQQMGLSLGRVSTRLLPQEPGLGQAMREGSDALNKLLRMALNARTERDLKVAIRTAALPARHLLERLTRVKDVYADQVQFYTLSSQALLVKVERATLQRGPRSVDLLQFYDMAQRTEEDLDRLAQSSRAAAATLTNLRRAHDKLVEAANNRIPAKEAFRSVRQIFLELTISLQNIADRLEGPP